MIGTPTSPTANRTDICQSLDLVCNGSLKSPLRAQCVLSMAHDVLQSTAAEVPERHNFQVGHDFASDERAHVRVVPPNFAELES